MIADLARAYRLASNFEVTKINVSENETFRINCTDGKTFALRLARPGYHTPEELKSELLWLNALQSTISAAKPIAGRDGALTQRIGPNNAVLFEWITGHEPNISENLVPLASELGSIAAKLHNHVQSWQRPKGFIRPRWDFEAAFGKERRWGDWRNGPGVSPDMQPLLQRCLEKIERQLTAFGQHPSRFNLIHGDLRFANLLVKSSHITVLDFDDSGFGWLMYDAATMVSFHEHEPQVPELIAAWVEGYRAVRSLSAEDEAMIATLVMFRRILLLAWLGSHNTIDLAKQLRPTFAGQTARLCEQYLSRN